MTTHKMCSGFEYQAWKRMLQSVTNENSKGWSSLGAKGISVSEDFKSFIKFYEAMGNIPAHCNTIVRINKDIEFCKENCVWGYVNRGRPRGATKEVVSRKKKSSKFKNPKVLAVTIESDHLEYIRKQALQKSLENGFIIETTDLVREALVKSFPLPKQYDMFGGKIK